MDTIKRSASFTGHRNVLPEHRDALIGLIDRALAYLYSEGVRRFCCGGALGFDTMAAKQIVYFKLRHPDCELHLILPCKNQAESWGGADAGMYDFLLSEASSITYVADEYTEGCMKKRNQLLVDSSDIIVAYLYREYSGAGQTVRMAKRLGKTVYNLYTGLQ